MKQTGAVRRVLFFVILAVIAMGAVAIYLFSDSDDESATFRLARIERGPIISTVSSTGTLNAVITVQVGSQVSGQIMELLADFNSEVREDQVIARIDPENFQARVRQAEAELAVSKSNVSTQRAAVERARAELQNSRAALDAVKAQTEKARVAVEDAKRDLTRKETLHKSTIIAESEKDKAVAVYDQAVAQLNSAHAEVQAQESMVRSRGAALKMAKAQVEHALAQVKQREAALHQSRVDLEHTVIRSPVDGVVIERSVDVGQTVAASLQAPTLFTIAQDLRKMQVDTNVDEADIGRIRMGQRVTFTVDSFPGQEFKGFVKQIRKAPETVQNVVTYTVVVSADNPDLRLLPGMTANVQIVVNERLNTLKVANAALRFSPSGAGAGKSKGAAAAGRPMGGGPQQTEKRIRQITEALQLDEAQQEQLKAMFDRARKQIIAMRQQGATPEEIRAEIQRIRARNRGPLLQMLTPEQRVKYRQFVEGRAANQVTRGRVWVMGENGTPTPVDIMLGISDGSFTEVVQGELEADQQVIIGVSRPEKKSKGTGRRRFGF
ncbi:MAG: efflux RND transporter periplasmic adaptor subunit [Desulfobacteraceae bacterium]|jgi:HlyD family secretion protein